MTNQNKWKSTFFTIAFGQTVSLIGSSAVQFALIWWLAEKTASPLIMGISGLVAFLPMAVLSPFAGIAADKYNRKLICIISDMSMGVMALIYSIFLFFTELPIWMVLVVLFIRGVGGTFQSPAIQSIIPQLVPSEQLVKVNGWMQMMVSGSFLLGPVIGAAMYAVLPMWLILLTDLIGAIFASITLAIAKIPPLERKGEMPEGFFKQFKEGINVYRDDRKLFMIIVAQAGCMFFYAPLSSFYPLMTSSYFKLTAIHGSLVEMAFAVGMMISALLFGSVLKVKHKIGTAYIGLLGVGITSAICGLLPPVFMGWVIFTIVCALMGGFGNVHSIPLMAYMQETIEPEKMGRAFSVMAQIGSLTMPVGLFIASPIAEEIGVPQWFFISGIGIVLIVGIIIVVNLIKRSRGTTN